MDVKTSNGVWELKRFCMTRIELQLIFDFLSYSQARRKHFGSGAAIGTKKTAGGLRGAVSPPAGPGQSPGGGPGGEAPGSSVNLGILKP